MTEDALLGGAVRLLQPRRGHRAGTDAVLLAALAPVRDGDRVLDLGAATGAVGLMIAQRREGVRVALVERDPELAELATRNIAMNTNGAILSIVRADLFSPPAELAAAGLALESADLVVTNPPFFQAGEARSSPDRRRRSAHVMQGGDLAGWCAAAAVLLRPRGRVAMIHRANALPACIAALARGFGSLSVRPIYPRRGEAASRILLTAVKGARSPARIEPGLVLHEDDGRFTPEAARLHALPQMKEAPEGAS